jgi:ribosomal protein S18 acetylase RimI-like enzyme
MTRTVAICKGATSDWPKIPLIYEADGYDRAAAGMRSRAAQELAEFAAGHRVLFLAEVDGTVAGTVGLVFQGMDAGYADGTLSGNISRLHVVQAHRRRGIGTALMAAAEAEARARGFRKLVLEVETDDDSAAARALYEKLGFHIVGPGHHVNEIALSRDLA